MPRSSLRAFKALGLYCLIGAAVAQPSQQFEPLRPSGYGSDGQRMDNGPAPSVNENTVILNKGGYDPEAFYVKPANPNAAPKKIANHHVAPPPAETANSGIARRIYRCKDSSNTDVYADDDNQHKFRNCIKVREERLPSAPVAIEENPAPQASAPQAKEHALPTCSGALLYKGSTYVFSDLEPCPIPDEVFEARRPLEASADYYAPPAQNKP